MLGERIGLPKGVLRSINSEHPEVRAQGQAMFKKWKDEKRNGATMLVLMQGLEKIGRRDLSEKVQGTQTLL